MIGSEIGHYKIVERLGAGGMGEVWKAEDTTLGRPVALKFLAAHLLNDDEAKTRFLREARAAAAVRHPNICHVYEVAEENGKTFLAMDYLEGEPLEDRITKGPLPLKQALDIGRQIAEGLEAAHEKGIVHRDIKPANVIVDAKGRVTILDFGLARLTEASKLTRAGQTVGTAAYMSPEQIQGEDVDHRTDIWALGCVLYEMVAGVRPFPGQYDQALAYEIVNQAPEPLTGLRAGVPMQLEFIVGKCLAKDREDRHQSAKEMAVDLRTLAEKLKSGRSAILQMSPMTGAVAAAGGTMTSAEALPPGAVVVQRSNLQILGGVAAALALAVITLTFLHFRSTPPSQAPLRRFGFAPPAPLLLGSLSGYSSGPEISPDGRYIAFTTAGDEGRIWIQDLAQEQPLSIGGTSGAIQPFWSPDSDFVGFATDRELKKVSVQGGPAVRVCELPGQHMDQASWSPDGESIVFSSDHQLYEVPARGGAPHPISQPDEVSRASEGSGFIIYPRFLPVEAGRRVLLYAIGASAGATMFVRDLERGERRQLGMGALPFYSPTGHIVYQKFPLGVWALPFSLDTLQPTGEAFPIAEDGVYPTAANDGTLVYVGGNVLSGMLQAVWRDSTGKVLEVAGQPQVEMSQPSLSPDGGLLAVLSQEESGNRDVWVHDLARTTKTRLTFGEGRASNPVWSPSGREVVYRQDDRFLHKAADGTSDAAVLIQNENLEGSPDWSRDGRYLIYSSRLGDSLDLRYVEVHTDGSLGESMTFLGTPANESNPKFSPDGRYVAYASDESGLPEVYVRPFPGGDGRWQASVNGGVQLRWSQDGNKLFFVRDDTLMSVSVSTGQGVVLGRPQELFQSVDLRSTSSSPAPRYDVSADGQRFLTIAPAGEDAEAPPMIRVVQNWYEEFRDRERR